MRQHGIWMLYINQLEVNTLFREQCRVAHCLLVSQCSAFSYIQVNKVAESVRRKFLFKQPPHIEVDLSKDYVNKEFTAARRDKELFSRKIYEMSPGDLIFHINAYRHRARKAGKKMNIFDEEAIR